MMSQYIYLLQEREFIKTREHIYKVGMTKKENHERFNQYPKGSLLLFQMICNNCKIIETHVVKLFKQTFKQRKDIGNEYFEGDYKNMIDIIYLAIKNEINEYDNNDKIIKEEPIEKITEYIPIQITENTPIQITTYEEYIKNNDIISGIIITKKEATGFLRFKGQLWRDFYDINCLDWNDTYMEDLLGFINNYQNVSIIKNKITNVIINFNDYHILDNSEKNNYYFTDVEYNVEKILQDILNKCYVKKCDLYVLKYHEYVFSINNNHSSVIYVIYNSINFTFTPVDELISNKILTYKDVGIRSVYVKNIINISIVDNILNSLIATDIKFQYKKLVYNLIVNQEENEKQIIFYDYNKCLLTTWIKDLLDTISGGKLYALSCSYYDDKIEFKKLIKTHNYRCVIIQKYKDISIETQIKNFCKLGFKNIIVCQNNTLNNMYDIVNFRKHLYNNKEMILNCIKEENKYEPKDWESDIKFDDDIFYRTNLLLTNFLKWCSVK